MKRTEEGGESQFKKGFWTVEEDKILMDHVKANGKGQWNRISKNTGLKRNGKSCRLRWMNYLSPTVKHGDFSEDEEDLIIRLHRLLGNRWALIAKRVPGRTDNQVKNYWNTHLSKKLSINEQKRKSGDSSNLSSKGGEVVSETTMKPSSSDEVDLNCTLKKAPEAFVARELETIGSYSDPFWFPGEELELRDRKSVV